VRSLPCRPLDTKIRRRSRLSRAVAERASREPGEGLRTIKIHLSDSIEPDDYAHVANAVWMLLRATGHDYEVEPDGEAQRAKLDKIWDGYSDVSWKNGARRGTDQAERSRLTPHQGDS